MKKVARILLLSIIVMTAAVITITACGGNKSSGGTGAALRALVFNSNPLGFHVTRGFGPSRASIAPFTVNAQNTTPGGGNFPGFCDSVLLTNGRARTTIYGIGRWTSGNCQDGQVQFSDVGVNIPQAGQIGNLTLDAISVSGSSGADDGLIGINGTASGQMEITIIHADGSLIPTSLTCSLGVTTPNQKVHCEDKTSAHHIAVAAGDQITAQFWYNGNEQYRAIRVNIEFATPTF
jgi:FlaG/FlaF family flagellin (archaellin)